MCTPSKSANGSVGREVGDANEAGAESVDIVVKEELQELQECGIVVVFKIAKCSRIADVARGRGFDSK